MGKMYEDWNKLFCDQLVEEIRKFEKCQTKEQLCIIKDLIEVTNGLQEMEMDGAIRRIAEDRYGYDSSTGRFRSMPGSESYGGDDMALEFMEMFNAGRGGNGRGGRRRRDSRGRYMAMMPDYPPNVFYPPDPDEYPWEYGGKYGGRYYNDGRRRMPEDENEDMDDVMNARGRNGNGRSGGRNGSSGRGGNRGGVRNDGREYSGNISGNTGGQYGTVNGQDDGMYMLRQQNGMPIMTPYNAHDPHDIPKKLTKEQYKEWMNNIMNSDGSSGPHWTVEQTKVVQQKKGVSDVDEYAWWAAMNAVYSDTCEFFAKKNMNNIDTYADFAKLFWFEDEDAVGGGEHNAEKLAAYYTSVVEH